MSWLHEAFGLAERDKLAFALVTIFFALLVTGGAAVLKIIRSIRAHGSGVERDREIEREKDSAKRLAQLREKQANDREMRLHQHFRDYRDFTAQVTSDITNLAHRADEMESDVRELKGSFADFVKLNTAHREEVISKLASMEGAAHAFAALARDARRTLKPFFPEAPEEGGQ